MSLPIALQLYSVREDAKNDLFHVLAKTKEFGYDGVEFAGYYGHEASEIKKALDDLGLKAEGTHTAIAEFSDEKLGATVEIHHTLDCKFAIVPWIPEDMRNSEEACHKTAAIFTELTEKLKAYGLRTGFHAHDGDLIPLSTGKSAWDLLAANTPDEFILQYDTANGMSGGADPVQPILNWPGRSTSVHLKGPGEELVGEAGIDWPKVFEACETVGKTQWYVVEHEDYAKMSALDAVKVCIENLRALGK
jgi:sugar phosphate isomerase/epimerase